MSLAASSATKYSLRPVFNMRKDDRIRLQHMLDAVNEALSFIQGKIRPDLDQERMLVLSLIRELEIIGEAASKVLRKPDHKPARSHGKILRACAIA